MTNYPEFDANEREAMEAYADQVEQLTNSQIASLVAIIEKGSYLEEYILESHRIRVEAKK